MKKNVLVLVSLFVFFAINADAKIGYNITKKNILKPTKISLEKESKAAPVVVPEVKKNDVVEDVAKVSETDDVVENVEKPIAEISGDKKGNLKKSRLEKRREQIAEERARETSIFKKQAIENTVRREKKHEELLKRKRENESVFQKEAIERAEEKARIKEEILKEKMENESVFQREARERAEERAKNREFREQNLKRNKNK